jgi:hypothetical protein
VKAHLSKDDTDKINAAKDTEDAKERKKLIIEVLDRHKRIFDDKMSEYINTHKMSQEEAHTLSRPAFEGATREVDSIIDTSTTDCYRQYCMCKNHVPPYSIGYCNAQLKLCLDDIP